MLFCQIIGYGAPFYILFHDAPPQTGVIYQFIIDWKIGTVQLGHSLILFLEQGYGRTTTAQIARKAGMSPASFFAAFENKEALLLRLTQIMFRSQFSRAEKMLPADQSPLLLYAMETGLQLHVAECSEPLRDLYVTAYSLPSTSDFINRSMTPRLRQIFSRWMKRADDSELFELELASAGVTRSYMSVPCDMYFTMERKIRRYLSCCFRIYCVPEKEYAPYVECVLQTDLHQVAENIVAETVQNAAAAFAATMGAAADEN